MSCYWTDSSPVWPPGSPDWCPGPPPGPFTVADYLFTCLMTSDSMPIASEGFSRADLAPFELTDLIPTGPSCTIASTLTPRWTLNGWSSIIIWQSWNIITEEPTEVDYVMSNAAFDGSFTSTSWSIDMTPYLPTTNSHTWYPCSGPAGSISCQWQIDLATGYIALNQSWYCDDKDSEHP
jgi:hypothetical protein